MARCPRVRVTTTALLAAALTVAFAAPARAATGWTLIGKTSVSSLTGDEGVATVATASGTTVRYRGVASIPLSVLFQGWTHIGDPDAHGGYFVDAYQRGSSGTTKMFRVTTPAGRAYEYVHALVPGELFNNSFDAISPDGQWMVAGEWNTMTHLQVYPTPLLNPATAPTGGPLPLSGYITLDHAVNDVQGCDFVTATRLLCSSDDSSLSLWPDPKPLLQVDLPAALAGGDTPGHVTDLGSIPQQSACSGTYEAEGIDYDPSAGQLRVEMIPPGVCAVVTDVYRYQPA
jgi:hypothetical protein